MESGLSKGGREEGCGGGAGEGLTSYSAEGGVLGALAVDEVPDVEGEPCGLLLSDDC